MLAVSASMRAFIVSMLIHVAFVSPAFFAPHSSRMNVWAQRDEELLFAQAQALQSLDAGIACISASTTHPPLFEPDESSAFGCPDWLVTQSLHQQSMCGCDQVHAKHRNCMVEN